MQVSILEYGAVGDGVTMNTQSIQTAIDACAQNGGGQVVIPAGVFLSGTIWLKSHVFLLDSCQDPRCCCEPGLSQYGNYHGATSL